MVSDAQKKANENYRKNNVKSFNWKLFPADQDIIEWMDGIEGKAAYLKKLVRDDMKHKEQTRYAFETANMGTCEIEVYGEYRDGTYDVSVSCGDIERNFEEIDAGSVDDIFQWLLDEGVEFESTRSLWYNVHHVASVMLDRDATPSDILDKASSMSDEQLDSWRGWFD